MNISLLYPVNFSTHSIIQCFGENPMIYRRFIVAGRPLEGHNGLDFASGDYCSHSVLAAAPGQVIKIGFELGGFGNYVKIKHPGFTTLYAHLARVDVGLGQVLEQIRLIGITGSTGFSTGPGPDARTGIHLHFGLYPDDEPRLNGFGGAIDPSPYFEQGDEYFPTGCIEPTEINYPGPGTPGQGPGPGTPGQGPGSGTPGQGPGSEARTGIPTSTTNKPNIWKPKKLGHRK